MKNRLLRRHLSMFLILILIASSLPITAFAGGEDTGTISGKIADWSFNEGSGTTVTDSVYAIEGMISGGSWTDGKIGKALQLNGEGGNVRVGTTNEAFNNLNSLTIGMWVYPDSSSTNEMTILLSSDWSWDWQIPNSTHALQWSILWDKDNYANSYIAVGVIGSSSTEDPVYGSTSSIAFGKDIRDSWHYLAFSYDVGTKTVRYYLDGTLLNESSYGETGTAVYADLRNFMIGEWNWDYPPTRSFKGKLDELKIFNRVLTGDEILQLYNEEPPVIEPTPTPIPGSGTIYYVDGTNGNDDTGDGSPENPWKTISKAASIMVAGDTCRIRSGVYRETVRPANSGAEGDGNAITFEPDTDAEVIISGADLIPADGWVQHSGSIYKTNATLSMGDFFDQVYVDGVKMNLARHPNAPVNELYDPDFSTYLVADEGSEGMPYFQGSGKIVDADLTQPDGYWDGAAVITTDSYGWCLSGALVSSYTTGVLNLGSGNVYSIGRNSRYYIVGKLGALDYPGEWYYDKAEGILYLQTPENDDPSSHVVEVKKRDLGFNLRGREYINIRGIKLFASTIDATGASNCVIEGINAKYLSDFYKPANSPGGIILGGTGNTLKNSTLSYSSGAVVCVEGENNKVINNMIQYGTYGPTLFMTAVNINGKGHLVSHNTVRYASREVIGGNFFASEIQYNDFSYGNQIAVDTGLMYLAHTGYGNSEVHHNYFHDSVQGFSCGFYADVGVRNILVYNNVFWNIPGEVLDTIFVNDSSCFVSIFNNTLYNKSKLTLHSGRDAYRDIVANNITLDGMPRDNEEVGAVFSKNMTSGDPAYVDPSANNFRLTENSEAIDQGVEIGGITEGFIGSAPDYGAYEYGGADWSAGHNFSKPPNPEYGLADYEFKNFVINGGFEWPRVGLSSYDTLYGWTRTNSLTASVVQDDGTSSKARWNHKFGCSLGQGEDGIEQTVTGLKPNTAYEFRGFARVVDSSQSVRLGVKDFGGDDIGVDVTDTYWQEVKFTFTTGDSNTSATVYAYKPTTGGIAYVDDIMLSVAEISLPGSEPEPTPEPTPTPPPYISPVAIIDDMLQDSPNWLASDNSTLEFSRDQSLRISGNNTHAGYYGKRYKDQEIYLNLNPGEVLGDEVTSIVLRSTDPKKPVSDGNDGYQIVINKNAVEIQGWKDSRQEFAYSVDGSFIQAGQNNLLKVSAVSTDDGVRIRLKIGDVTAAEYLDETNLIPDEGYFGITAPEAVTISRITTPVIINDLLDDQSNWRASGSSTLDFQDGSLAVSGGNALAGYFGNQYENAEFVLNFKTDTTIPQCWPSIALRSSDPLKDLWAGNDAYTFVFKKNIFEIQCWKDNGNRLFEEYPNNTFIAKTNNLVKVSAIDTDEGVWLRLKIGNEIVANFVDTENILPDAGYFGVIAWTPVTLSKVIMHTITASAGMNGAITSNGVVEVADGADMTYTFIPDSGYEVDKVIADGSEVNVSGNSYTFEDVTEDHTISVTFKRIEPTPTPKPTSKPTPTPAPTPTPTPTSTSTYTQTLITKLDASTGVIEVKASTTATAAVDSDTGKAVAQVSELQMAEAVTTSVEAAKAQEGSTNAVVEIKVEGTGSAKEVAVEFPKAAVENAIKNGMDTLVLDTGIGVIELDRSTLDGMMSMASKEAMDAKVSISVTEVDKTALEAYPEQARKAIIEKIGDRPVYDFNITVGDTKISDFQGGSVNITLPYTPKDGEDINAIVIFYIDDNGNLECVPNCKYDPETETISFSVKHFSRYAIAYNAIYFTDVPEKAWCYKPVSYIAARNIVKGVGGGRFDPDGNITRADFIIMLMRAYGIDIDTEITDNFSDAGDKYYTPYLATAKRLGLVKGVGNNMYMPEEGITRQDMIVMLYNTLNKLGRLPVGANVRTLEDFNDSGDIASYAVDAVKLFVEKGIIKGSGKNLNPRAVSTRAEVAQTLYNLLSK